MEHVPAGKCNAWFRSELVHVAQAAHVARMRVDQRALAVQVGRWHVNHVLRLHWLIVCALQAVRILAGDALRLAPDAAAHMAALMHLLTEIVSQALVAEAGDDLNLLVSLRVPLGNAVASDLIDGVADDDVFLVFHHASFLLISQ